MADKTVSVEYRASVGGYISEVQRAGRANKQFASEAQAAAKASESAGARAAHALGSGLATAVKAGAAVLTTVTGGVAALGVSAFKTGVSYNALQQSSRAALTTILKGSKQANEQMDKLDAFARNSPFAKQVFISAQQQLLGFGLEAKKVIPALDAIQNSVAAVGGSNEDISNVTDALAKMMGSGKLAGDTLNRLGLYGIDAAGIIGKSMGKTGAEIRAMASKPGGIPVDKVWDPLIKGLEKNFGGAAANVKKTWVGATDRIKGAWRDIGSALAEPFVGHKGGGLAIEWVNKFADLLRAAQKQVKPLVDVLMPRLESTFGRITPALDKARSKIENLDLRRLNDQLAKMSAYKPLIAGTGAALAALGGNSLGLGRLGMALNPVVAGIGALVLASPELRTAGRLILDALKPLRPVAKELGREFMDVLMVAIRAVANVIEQHGVPLVQALAAVLTNAEGPTKLLRAALDLLPSVLGAAASAAGPLIDGVKWLVDLFGSLPGPVQQAVVMFGALRLTMGPLKDLFAPVTTAVRGFGDEMRLQAALAQSQGKKIGGAGAFIATGIARGVGGAKAALSGLWTALGGPWGIAIMGATALLTNWMNKNQEAKQRVQELTDAVRADSGVLGENTRAKVANRLETEGLLKDAQALGLNLSTFTDAAMGNEAAISKVTAALKSNAEAQTTLTTTGQGPIRTSGRLAGEAHRVWEAIKQQNGELGLAVEEYNRVEAATGGAATGLGGVASKSDEAAAAAKRAAEAQRDLANANLEISNAAIAASAANDRLEEATGRLSAASKTNAGSMKKSGESVKGMEEKARAGRAELRSFAEQALDTARKNLENEASVKDVKKAMDGSVATFIENAKRLGIGEERAKAMAREFGLTRGKVDDLKRSVGELPSAKKLRITLETFGLERLQTAASLLRQLPGMGGFSGALNVAAKIAGHATGGPIIGPGTGTSDSIVARLSHGEHVLTAREVEAAGGHAAILRMRKSLLDGTMPRFATGGPVGYAAGGPVLTGPDRVAIMALVTALSNPIRDLATATKAMTAASAGLKAPQAALTAATSAKQRADSSVAAAQKRLDADKAATAAAKARQTAGLAEVNAEKKRLDALKATRTQQGLEKRELQARITQLTAAAKATKGYTKADADLAAAKKQMERLNGSILKQDKAIAAQNTKVKTAQDKTAKSQVANAKAVDKAKAKEATSSAALTKAKDAAKAATDRQKTAQENLKAAQDRATEAAKALADMQKAVADQAARVSDQLRSQVDGPGTNISAWIDRLATGATDVATFAAQVEQLRKGGLDEMLVQQIIGAGARGGSRVAAGLLEDKAAIKELNSASGSLQEAADKLGLLAATGIGRYAGGGEIGGRAGVDKNLILATRGEHMLDTSDVAAMGGQQAVYAFRAMLHNPAALRSAPARQIVMAGSASIDYQRLGREVASALAGLPGAVEAGAARGASVGTERGMTARAGMERRYERARSV